MTRKEAIEKVKDMMDYIIRFHAPNDVFVDHMNEAIEALKETRPSGEWIEYINPNFSPFDGSSPTVKICSVCKFKYAFNPRFAYCPECGASMKEGCDEE